MSDWRFERYRSAYHTMWERAKYRPAAPSDGFGHIMLTEEELLDPDILEKEACKYAIAAYKKEDDPDHTYLIGCPDSGSNRALLYVIEAARALCAPDPTLAENLLKIALEEIATEYPKAKRRRW